MEEKITHKSLEFWFILLVITGYVVASSPAIPLGMEEKSRYFAVPFRFMIFFISLYIILRNFSWQKLKSLSVITLLLFWLYYTIQVVKSYYQDFYEVNVLASWNEIYARIGLIIIFPSLALMFINYRNISLKKLALWIFYVLFGMLTINLLYSFINAADHFKLPYMFSIYYISYGHLGTSLALISLFFLLFVKSGQTSFYIFSSGLLIGLFTLFIATARSPFLALSVASLYLIVVKKKLKLMLLFSVVLLASVLGIWWYVQNGYTDFKFITRTYAWLFEGDNSLRTPLFEKSIKLFKEHPFLGSRILYEDGSYPHNIFLELLMATGILGFLIYFLKFLPVIRNIKIFFSPTKNVFYIMFFALFLQYFVLTLTSYNLFSVPEFIHLSALIIGISLTYQYEKTKSNDGGRNPSGNHPPLQSS